jgi:hypothetical protein
MAHSDGEDNKYLKDQLTGILQNILQICNGTYFSYDENVVGTKTHEIHVDVGSGDIILCEAKTNFSYDMEQDSRKWNCRFTFSSKELNAEWHESAIANISNVLKMYMSFKLLQDLDGIVLHAFQKNITFHDNDTEDVQIQHSVFFMEHHAVVCTYSHYSNDVNDESSSPSKIVIKVCYIECTHQLHKANCHGQ